MKYNKENKIFYFNEYEMGDPANAIEQQLLTAYYGYKEGQEVYRDVVRLKNFVNDVLIPSAFIEEGTDTYNRGNCFKEYNEPSGYFSNNF